jgi:Phage tail tube protein
VPLRAHDVGRHRGHARARHGTAGAAAHDAPRRADRCGRVGGRGRLGHRDPLTPIGHFSGRVSYTGAAARLWGRHRARRIALEFTRSGPAAATTRAIAQGEIRLGATQGGTPANLTFSRISQFQGSIKRTRSPVGKPDRGRVTYPNNLEKIETIRDDGPIEGADPTIAALTGRIDVRFADTTLIDLAAGVTPVDLEFAYTLSAQAKLVLTAHEVYLPKPKLAVEGPGGVQASFDFGGAKNDAAARMLTVTLTNDLDGTVYA